MDQETYELLEFDQVIQIISGLTQSSPGRTSVEAIIPQSDLKKISKRQKALKDILQFLKESPRISCSQLEDLGDLFNHLRLGVRNLEPEEFLKVLAFLKLGDSLQRTVQAGKLQFLRPELPRISIPPQLKQSIVQAISPDGEILDSAHPGIRNIRKKQETLRKKINQQLKRYFQSHSLYLIPDPFITQRAGRFVIPVRAENQRQIPGIVHGTSSSGATVFLEPLGATELNNELVWTVDQESELIRLVLQRLTEEVSLYIDQLNSLSEIAGTIDSLFACSEFYLRFNCTIPNVGTDVSLSLKEAYHPLLLKQLGKDAIVSISIDLDTETSALVISGPNTGGKTAALKTAGLLSLMALAGLPVPADDASIPLLKGIFADIGDHQSITQQLSTFSAHVMRINSLIKEAEKPSLLLLDELGRGTDPIYGSVLAVATIDHFLKQGLLILTTTHHRLVKSYAGSTPGIQNASVHLDPVSHQPTYTIELNSTGHSSGLEIAQQLGLSPVVIEKARSYLDHKELEVERYLEVLKDQMKQMETRETDLRNKISEAQKKEKKREVEADRKEKDREKKFEQNLEKWGNEFRKDSKRLISRVKDRMDAAETRRQLNQRNEQLKEEFRRKSKARRKSHTKAEPGISLLPGDNVFHDFFRKKGTVISVNSKEVIVDIEGKRVSAKSRDLSKIETRDVTRNPSKRVTVHVIESTEPELNLIGQRIDDALPVIDKFLDRAVVSRLKEIRIIHGFGTGRLKSSISGFLSDHPQVDNFKTEGGSTRVFLRD